MCGVWMRVARKGRRDQRQTVACYIMYTWKAKGGMELRRPEDGEKGIRLTSAKNDHLSDAFQLCGVPRRTHSPLPHFPRGDWMEALSQIFLFGTFRLSEGVSIVYTIHNQFVSATSPLVSLYTLHPYDFFFSILNYFLLVFCRAISSLRP